jgi:two-component system response regulator
MGDMNPGQAAVRVLVIEDNADDRELLLRQLSKSGMDQHVKFISDGREALDYLTGPSAASLADNLIAILLDLQLPSLSGLELLRRLRSRQDLKEMPVIVMTSSNKPEDLDECRQLKVLNYVSKPVTFSSFSKAVADVFHLPSFLRDGKVEEGSTGTS